jgi:hypothetical protein
MKKFVLMVAMVVSCVCMAQNSHAQTGRDGNTDIDMLSMKNFYAIDIVDVDLAAQEAIYNAYENCLIKEVYKSAALSSIRSLSRRLTSGIWLSLSTKAAMY